jgi:hypothetical protein
VTVEDLRKKLEGIDPKTHVVVYRETDNATDFFEIDHISLSKGKPYRDKVTRKAGFTFDQDGLVEWLFITVEDA